MTMITRINSAMTQFTLLLSALAGAPACFSAAVSFFWSQPSILVVPMVVVTVLPSAGTDLNDNPCFVRKSFTRSQSENLLHGPTKRWNWHSAGLAATVIGFFCENSSSAGLT